MWFVDIAYDEIAERYYKESEVRGVKSPTCWLVIVCCAGAEIERMHVLAHASCLRWLEEKRLKRTGRQRRRELLG